MFADNKIYCVPFSVNEIQQTITAISFSSSDILKVKNAFPGVENIGTEIYNAFEKSAPVIQKIGGLYGNHYTAIEIENWLKTHGRKV